MNITPIVQAAVVSLCAVVTYVLVPYIKSKRSAAERQALADNIRTAVYAAEQIYTQSGLGREKKQYVLKWLKAQGITYDEQAVLELVDAMIESTVLELKKEG